jgi:hypothetical protein
LKRWWRLDSLVLYVYPRLRFAHLARCVAAIFLLAAALMVRFFPDLATLVIYIVQKPAKLFGQTTELFFDRSGTS